MYALVWVCCACIEQVDSCRRCSPGRWCAPLMSNACSALYRTVACIASISGCNVAHIDVSSPSCPPFQEDEEWKDFASGEQDLTGLKIQTTLEWVGREGHQ